MLWPLMTRISSSGIHEPLDAVEVVVAHQELVVGCSAIFALMLSSPLAG